MKEEIARSIMSDEAWDMVWEGLKEYCKINGMAEDYIKYDTYFKKPDLEVAKNKFMKLYNDEFKHYGYLVD